MYRKEQIVLVGSPVTYLQYILATDTITAFEYDYSIHEDVQEMERVHTLSISLFNNQFAVDSDQSAIFVAPSTVGKYVRVVYYSEGEANPFHASSNLHSFITKVLKWTSNRISEGIYLHWENCDPAWMKKINEGSFVYEGRFMVYNGGIFDVRLQSPPTIKGTYKAYRLFINQEIIDSYVFNQTQILAQLGIQISSTYHDDIASAKQDVIGRYTGTYTSTPIDVAYVYIRLTEELTYEVWVEYPPESRTL